MDREWMYGQRGNYFESKVDNEFCKVALEHQKRMNESHIPCPCAQCELRNKFPSLHTIRFHLSRRGFMPNYKIWFLHGERAEASSRVQSSSQYNSDVRTEIDVDTMANTEHDQSDTEISDDGDNVEQCDPMLQHVEDNFTDKPAGYQRLVDASRMPLFPSCGKYTKLTSVLHMFNLKARFGLSDKSFTALLELFHDMLPDDNVLPTSTYEAKKLMCPMGVEYEKIHACPNSCVLYRGENAHLDQCPKCNMSRYKQKEGQPSSSMKKKPPAKVIWYLPIIPRFKRLYANVRDAKNLRWHAEGRKKDDKLRHPADSPQWNNINRRFSDFADDNRNLRLGLCTDGMNPYGTLSSQHSTWPVLLVIYNLPSWLCMKRKYIMLSLLISGPKQPGNNIDVFLAPLIDDLKLLWNEGAVVYDAYGRQNFTLRAMLFCTINDFPAYGNLSGYTVKGAFACPICEDDTCSDRLKHCGKNIYMCHRRFLPMTHPYRRKKELFNGKYETRVARVPLISEQIYEKVKDIENVFGDTSKSAQKSIWKKYSIFWELPYWKHLPVRHCLDFMHIVKNVGEAFVGTLLNIPGKTKDGIKVRKDMVAMDIRHELHPQERGNRTYLPPACYTLSKNEKISFCKCLVSVKVPSGYSSNWKNLVSMKDLKLVGLKSHDYHVLMLHLLPIAIRGILPLNVRNAITRLCFFLNAVCNKVVDADTLDSLQRDVVVTLCQLEMYFPPSFFDIMVHLVVHVVREIKECGPIYLRYMYPFERYMGILKGRMKNRYRPEGSIIEGTTTEEVTEFCSEYLKGVEAIGVPQGTHPGGSEGEGVIGKKIVAIDSSLMELAHLFVLQHLEIVEPFIEQHMSELRAQHLGRNLVWLTNEQNKTFCTWFRHHVMRLASVEPAKVSEEIRWLAMGPGYTVISYEGYDINGFTYWTKRQDDKCLNQNSGVKVEATTTEYDRCDPTSVTSTSSWYYGFIEEIWELDYHFQKFVTFKCKWVDNRHGYRVHDGFTMVDLTRLGHRQDPFIFPKDCEQVFYIKDPVDSRWSVVLPGKRFVNSDVDQTEDDEALFDETPPFSNNLPVPDTDIRPNDVVYARSDHDEGLWIDKQK